MLIIKLLTLNTHSLIENNYKTKLKIFTDAILQEKPDIIALQEVNQTINCTPVPENELTGFYPCQSSVRITKDNHAYHIIKILNEKNINYYWTWLPLKNGYGKFDEGLAVLSLKPILKTDTFLITKTGKPEKFLVFLLMTRKKNGFTAFIWAGGMIMKILLNVNGKNSMIIYANLKTYGSWVILTVRQKSETKDMT